MKWQRSCNRILRGIYGGKTEIIKPNRCKFFEEKGRAILKTSKKIEIKINKRKQSKTFRLVIKKKKDFY